jgi:uncharacterized protein (TIGR00730 family)
MSRNSPPRAVRPLASADRVLLEGPHSRVRELWLVLRTVRDFVAGFRVLHFAGPCVTVFGSARFRDDHPFYALARQVGAQLARLGFTVMTGGGPGLMEAANRGAREAGGRSLGCNVQLPEEQQPNAYMDRWITAHYFFVRKVLLVKYSYAFIALPGGLGTLDELSEAMTLIQTGKIHDFPVVLMGTEYWAPLVHQLECMAQADAIGREDLSLLLVTDSVDQAMAWIRGQALERFGLDPATTPRPSAWLGEGWQALGHAFHTLVI